MDERKFNKEANFDRNNITKKDLFRLECETKAIPYKLRREKTKCFNDTLLGKSSLKNFD